jgi:replicative DNA helicase
MSHNGYTLTVTDGEASKHARVRSDVWEQALEDWRPVQFDAAMRAHFKRITDATRAKVAVTAESRRGLVPGDWLLDAPEEVEVVWGRSDAPLAVAGEALMIAGPQGVGKTTLGQQLALALAGIRTSCLGLPVKREPGKVLYLAMDRPDQIRRSFKRMLAEDEREVLRDRIVVWRGPLSFSVVAEPSRMAQFAREVGASHIVLDSYKDMASKLSDEEVGAKINEAMQECINESIGWTALHHNRKATADNKHPKQLSDIYGSGWLTAGLGSVISIYGEAGAKVVEARHIKQPLESFGDFGIEHDHEQGLSRLTEERPVTDGRKKGRAARQEAVLELLREQPELAKANAKNARAVIEELGLSVSQETAERDLRKINYRGGSNEELDEALRAERHNEDW